MSRMNDMFGFHLNIIHKSSGGNSAIRDRIISYILAIEDNDLELTDEITYFRDEYLYKGYTNPNEFVKLWNDIISKNE